jgi:ABC-type nitrate/sulfonate/bicarbonate transport system substrate-binding protein
MRATYLAGNLMSQKRALIVVWTAAAALAACLASFAQKPALEKVRVVCLNRPLAVVVAQTRGFFARRGIEVELDVAPNSETVRGNLASGKDDVAFLAVDNSVAMVELAGADAVIVTGGESSLNELMAQPEIKSIADLRGRTLLVDAPNTAYALLLKKVLLLDGLQPGKDCEIKPIGSTPIRLKAMRENKEYAASILNPPYSILARHAGLKSLGSIRTLLGADQDRGSFVLRPWARAHADLLTRYIAGLIEGQRWLLAPAHKQQVIELIAKESKLEEPVAAEVYAALMRPPGGYATDARFDVEVFRKTLELRAEIEGQWGGHAPPAEKYYDLSYYRAALLKLD